MKVQFVRGFKPGDDSNFNYIRYKLPFRVENSIGMFMNKHTIQFRYKDTPDLKRIADVNESFILIVIQDDPIETVKTLVHEITHFFIFRFFFDSERLHNLLDKIDNPLI